MSKIKAILKSKSGESLMEGIMSILVFTVLIATVTMMVTASMRITNVSLRESNQMQASFNGLLVLDEDDEDINEVIGDWSVRINFTEGPGINVNVKVFQLGDFTSFEP